jgi:hypothetical protein
MRLIPWFHLGRDFRRWCLKRTDNESPCESEMMLLAKAKAEAEVDWQSVNRILVENADFKDYIELLSTY